MKKLFLPVLVAFMLPVSFSCNTLRYTLNEADAAAAIRQLLQIGTEQGLGANAFNKQNILSAIFPSDLARVLNTMQQLGLSSEIDRFTTTLSTAAEQTAQRSIPVFVSGINRMNFTDAMYIIRNGGTSATDYLRSTVGTELRNSVKPVMQNALNEYKIGEQWANLIKPVQSIFGNKLNLDLATLMAGVVTESMFRKIAEKEVQIRTDANARTTSLLQRVFSRNWN